MNRSKEGGSGAQSAPPVVLIVDDNEGVRRSSSRILRNHGYRVIEAGTAEDAIWLCEAFSARVDVLIMDIVLPDGWGATVAQRLKEVHPEMAVVYITGHAATDEILSGGLADAPHVLLKPFQAQELLDVLAKALGGGTSSLH